MQTPFKSHVLILITALAGSAALTSCAVSPPTDERAGRAEEALTASRCPADTPSTLTPAEDQRLAFVLHGVGVQIYTCLSVGVWSGPTPRAELKNAGGQVEIEHFGGPTWQSHDGSTVVGAVDQAVIVDPTAIPWVLLHAASHDDQGRMTNITAIQRLSTERGKAPPDSACTAIRIGDKEEVGYEADYFFYKTGEGNPDNNPQCGG